MRVNKISSILFKTKINDIHGHIGHWECNGKERYFTTQDLDIFIKSPLNVDIQDKKQQDAIENIFVSNLDAFYMQGNYSTEKNANLELLNTTKMQPKYSLLYACQPNKTSGLDDIKEVFDKYPNAFVGLKFHTDALKDDLNNPEVNKSYCKYLEFAKQQKLPCLFHSQTIKDCKNYASVDAIHNLAKKFPEVPVIFAHCGGNIGVDDVIEAIKNKDSKLYCDISWLDWDNGLSDKINANVKKLIKELKKEDLLDRVIFGTDAPLGCFGENLVGGLTSKQAYEKTVSDIKSMIKNNFACEADEIIDKIFYKNADNLFF